MWALIEWFDFCPLTEISPNVFAFPEEGLYHGEQIVFETDGDRPGDVRGRGQRPIQSPAGRPRRRQAVSNSRRSEPVDELYKIARAATPPKEHNRPRKFDLVELTYARSDDQARYPLRHQKQLHGHAVLQAGARVHAAAGGRSARARAQKLKEQGFGLMIYDALPPVVRHQDVLGRNNAGHSTISSPIPTEGSKHNRGCAVDLTLYDLKTGKAVKMVGGYDEMTQRSYPFYPGGTSEERWHRKVLREAMQREGFTVYPDGVVALRLQGLGAVPDRHRQLRRNQELVGLAN